MDNKREDSTKYDSSITRANTELGFSYDSQTGQLQPGATGGLPETIGRYRLLNLVGEGGMGQVWRAIQEEPVRRTVALKLIGRNMGREALGRFEAERQAIAMMDHPNIAKVLDADTTDNGSPYFVMELVNGIPLDKYCNRERLGIDDRLRLMIPVCRAIQHAHQKAIIHRDLKHSNILVAENDDNPIPKVIDFGLAKALGSQKLLTDTTVRTEHGQIVGTIAYMSPEQAESEEQDVDTRSDIFSLGVVLYKLLTGKTPVQLEADSLSVLGALKIIKDKDPSPPSVAIRRAPRQSTWTDENTKLSKQKYAEQLRGDLDSIVLKALEKDRERRYETANEFAEDIERYLNKEPILARPRSAVYLVRKFVQRNRGLVASVFAILLLLITGIIGTTSALVYALKAQRETNTQLWALQLKSTWNDWNIGNTESAWQTLRQIDPESASWTSQYLANEMFTCEPSDILHGHASIVLTTDTSPDGTRILSGGADNVVYLWDANSNSKISRVLMDEMITSVRFSQNGESFLVADRSNTVSLFETQSGKRLHKYGPYEEDVSSVAFHPTRPFLSFGFFGNDSRRVGTVRKREFAENRPAKLVIVDLASGEIRLTLDGHADEITSLEFSQTGELLFSSCLDGGLRIWDCDLESDTEMRCELSRTIDVDPSGIHELALSPDGTTVVCAGQDQTASLYEIETGRLVARLTGHSAGLLGVDFSPRGDLIATCASDQTAIVWNLDGQIQKKLKGHSGPVNEVRFLPNGRQVVTASDDLKLRHWSMDVPGATWTQRDFHDTAQWQADFSPDKRTVATAGEDGLISLIDTRTGAFIKRLRHESGSLCLVWLESGRLITAGEGNELVVWDHPDNERAIQEPTRVVAIDDEIVWDISVSPDQRQIAFGGSDRSATILDAITLEAVGQLTGHQQGLASVRFSADGRYLVTASDDQSVKVWDAKNYELLQTLEGHHQPVWRAVFSPTDSRLIASSSADGSVLLWDWQKASIKTTFDGHASQVAGLAFTPDGKCLLSASDDGTVIVWDIELGMDLFVFEEQPSSAIIHASFSKDGQSLVTTGMGITTLRHARSVFRTPYLRRDATEEMLRWEYRVVADEIDDEEILKIERLAEKASRHNPSYLSLRNFGIAQSRLDKHPQAIETLLEAKRIQRVVYGGGDVRPFTEGFLAVSLLKNDEPERAREMKAEFESLAQEWQGDPRVQSVRARVRRAFSQ